MSLSLESIPVPNKVIFNKHKRMAQGSRHRKVNSLREMYAKDKKVRCYICKKKYHQKNTSLDHKLSLNMGGDNSMYNLALSCRKCNENKGKSEYLFEDYREIAKTYLDDITGSVEKIKKFKRKYKSMTMYWRPLLVEILPIK